MARCWGWIEGWNGGVGVGCGKEDELFSISLHLSSRDDQTKVVDEKELEFQFIQLCERQTTNLCISRICVKHIAKELAGDGNTSDDQPVDVVRVNHKASPDRIVAHFAHAVEIDKECEKDLVCCWTILENPE